MRAAPTMAFAALVLTACGGQDATAKFQERQAASDPPQLWLAEALDHQGRRVDAVFVCADRGLQEGLARATAWVNGAPCLPHRDAVDRQDLYAVRCEAAGRRFGLTLTRSGDLEQDFTVRFALKALDGTGDGAGHVRRYRKMAACPAGWGIGDQARPGHRPGLNVQGFSGRYVDLSARRS